MTTPEQNSNNEEIAAIIPSSAFLVIVGLGLVLGFVALLWQGELSILSGGLWLVSLIALCAWALMFPQKVLDIIKGRGLSFGGTAIVITVVLIIAAGLVYALIKSQNWRKDFSERDTYSLDSDVSDVLERMVQDPRIPNVTLIGVYDASSADTRDRYEVLFGDMADIANGKIAYRFIDPNRDVRFLQNYSDGATPTSRVHTGQVIVAVNDTETGEPSTERFELVNAGPARRETQFDIINAMLSLSAVGDFHAYFLKIDGGLDITDSGGDGAHRYADDLEKNTWTVEQVSPLQISGDEPQYNLTDKTADGEVLVIAGGAEPLDDTTMQTIQDYAANGGDLLIMGDINTTGGVATAQADNLSNFLWENYGVRLRNDLVLDPDNTAFGNAETIIIRTYGTHQIVDGLNSDSDWLVMESAHSVEIADPVPDGVTVTVLAQTTDAGYTKTGLDFSKDFTSDDLAFAADDTIGQIPVAVAVENTNTGSRLVLFGSDALLKNTYRQYSEVVSPEVVTSAIVWAADAENFADDLLKIVPDPSTQDSPVLVRDSDLNWITVVVLFLLPFGSLGLGLLVWWIQGKSRTAS